MERCRAAAPPTITAISARPCSPLPPSWSTKASRSACASSAGASASVTPRSTITSRRSMAAAADAIPPGKPLDRFRALGVGYVRYALEHPHRYRLQFRGGETGLPSAADASFHRVLEAVVACGARSRDPMATTILAWSAMHGLASLWIDGAFRKRLERRAMDALVHTITGLIAELLRA